MKSHYVNSDREALALPEHVQSWATHTRSKISEACRFIVPMVVATLCAVNVVSILMLDGHCSVLRQLLWLSILVSALIVPMLVLSRVLDAVLPDVNRAARQAGVRINERREAVLELCLEELKGLPDLLRNTGHNEPTIQQRWCVAIAVFERIQHILRSRIGLPAVTLAPRLAPTPSLLSA